MLRNIIAPEQVNTGRQLEIDLAKTMAILAMILVHLLGKYYTVESFVTAGQHVVTAIIAFGGGPLSAPVFMTAMGIGLAYSRNQDPGVNARRGVWLIFQGYILNFLRDTVPLLILYFISSDEKIISKIWPDTYMLDILQFAGMAFLFFALARHWKLNGWALAAITFVFLCVEWVVPPMFPEKSFLATIPGYFLFQNLSTCFPLFGWLAYPVTGYLFGKLLRRVKDKRRFYAMLLVGSTTLFAVFTFVLIACDYDVLGIYMGHNYFKHDPIKFTWIILICFFWFSLLYFISLTIQQGRVRKLIEYVSARLNDIYIVHWILLSWIAILFIKKLSGVYNYEFIMLFIGITACSILTVYLKDKILSKKKSP